ncbi:hypothetical protein FA95DRAFT_1552549 [Auriscalpium vulgare]|uniref:Uncharacterized protein n=1 Tax=Auriscalpium vulgare TaxID=40419 RepID=A0ACB8SAJ0_9AGAM|nr:hypothetical protein FA95DRAFT_1552549 [Auriscalpium vulgare]
MATPVSEATADSSPSSATRARGRGRGNRGGLGKYLRARGRRGAGRPAVFNERLVLDGEGSQELEEEEARERELKYSRRQLGTNADRYVEPEPEIGSDGEEVVEPEVDISKFLERQRLDDAPGPSAPPDEEDSDVDESLAHLTAKSPTEGSSRKGKVQQIEWNQELEDMRREKAVAQAHWGLKERFRAKVAQQRGRGTPRATNSQGRSARKQEKGYVTAPPLPTEMSAPPKDEKAQMEEFLDDLLT